MKTRTIFAASVATVALAACDTQQTGGDATAQVQTGPPALTVNGSPISTAAFDLFAKSRIRDADPSTLSPEDRKRMIDELVKLKALALTAEQEGLAADPEIAGQLEIQHMNLLAQNLLRRYMENNPITDEDVKAKIQSEASASGAIEFKARHILVETKEEAEDLIKQLDDGAEFAALAEAHSNDGSASRGGDLGWFTGDTMVRPFSEALAKLENGTYSKEPVQTQFGFHIILAEDKRDAPFGQIAARVRNQMQRDLVETYVNEMFEAATVVDIAQNQ